VNARFVRFLTFLAFVAIAPAFVRLNVALRAAFAHFVLVGAQQAVGARGALGAEFFTGLTFALHIHTLGARNVEASGEKGIRHIAHVASHMSNDLLFGVAVTVADVALSKASALISHVIAGSFTSVNTLANASRRMSWLGTARTSVVSHPAPGVHHFDTRHGRVHQALAIRIFGAL